MTMRGWILVSAAVLGAFAAGFALLVRRGETPVSTAGTSRVQLDAPQNDPATPSARTAPGPRGGGATAPRDAPEADDRIGNTDPTSKDYDPVTVLMTTHAKPSELLKKEPRNPVFADSREAELREQLVNRLRERLPFETKLEVDCRTSACDLSVTGAHGMDQMNAVLDAIEPSRLAESAEIGSVGIPGDPDARGVRITLLYSAGLRDRVAYEQWLRQHPPHGK